MSRSGPAPPIKRSIRFVASTPSTPAIRASNSGSDSVPNSRPINASRARPSLTNACRTTPGFQSLARAERVEGSEDIGGEYAAPVDEQPTRALAGDPLGSSGGRRIGRRASRLSGILAQLPAGERPAVHLVRAVGEAQRAGAAPTGAASGKSWLTPPAPCAWIALSSTHSAIGGTAILIAWISVCAPLLPTVSISQAVLSTSSRACSMRTRDSAIHSPIDALLGERLAERDPLDGRAGTSAPAPARPCRSAACSGGCGRGRAGPARWRSRRPRRAIRFDAGTRTSSKTISAWPPCEPSV